MPNLSLSLYEPLLGLLWAVFAIKPSRLPPGVPNGDGVSGTAGEGVTNGW
jgi:hypothetical protein